MFKKIFWVQGVVFPCPGAIYMYMTIILKHLLAKTFKNLLLQNQKAYDFETWYEASGNGALQRLYKS